MHFAIDQFICPHLDTPQVSITIQQILTSIVLNKPSDQSSASLLFDSHIYVLVFVQRNECNMANRPFTAEFQEWKLSK